VLSAVLVSGFAFSQTRETGVIQGKIVDEEGVFLPGVTVTVSSEKLMGTRSAITDAEGDFRIPALPNGIYVIDAVLEGFTPIQKTNVQVFGGMTATVDFVMAMARMEEEITVIGETPLIDTKDSAMAKTIVTTDFFENIPTIQDASQILNYAPSVVEGVSFGGGQLSNSFQLDGLELIDSWAGSGIYTTAIDYNVIEETQIVGLGAPAEYGNFAGSLVNIITKSGGNVFSGDAQLLFQGSGWSGKNTDPNDPYWGLVGETPKIQQLDTSAHLGGPIMRDKLWFFLGFQYFRETTELVSQNRTGLLTYPKYFGKLTWQPSQRTRIQGYFEHHNRQMENQGMSSLWVDPANYDLLYPVYMGNLSIIHQFSDSTLLELRGGGYDMGWDSIPHNRDSETPGHYDFVTGEYTRNTYWWSHWESNRQTVQATISHYVENLLGGAHDFKLGYHFARASGGGEYTLNGGVVYFDLAGAPYIAQSFIYRMWAIYNNHTFWAQDSWQITDRLTINPGLRFTMYRGSIPSLNETVYKPTAWEPRIGFAWDIFGTHKTVIKGHYGKYMENVKAYYISSLEPSTDTENFLVGENWELIPWYTTPGADLYSIDPNIKHPHMHQITAGVEQIVGQDISLGVSFIWRKWGSFIESVNTGSNYSVGTYMDPVTGNPITVYNSTNLGEEHYLITNPEVGVDYGQAFDGVVWVNPYRNYTAVEFSFRKRMSDNWQMFLSYVYSDENGTYSNSSTWQQSFGMGLSSTYQDPNKQTFIDGRSDVSVPHTLKVQGTYIFPLDFIFSAYYTLHTGVRWARSTYVPLTQGATEVLAEPSGSRRQDTVNNLDLRLEKSFNIDKFRLRFWADVFNVFNQGYGDYIYATDGPSFGLPLYVNTPRTLRAGIRFQF
jgi:hypothetical protein